MSALARMAFVLASEFSSVDMWVVHVSPTPCPASQDETPSSVETTPFVLEAGAPEVNVTALKFAIA
jgi:hypothetical protein